jgi:putative ABC transport system permease protein
MRLIAGRMLTDVRGEDRMKNPFPAGIVDGLNILVDQTAAARFGFTPEGAVGKTVLFGPSHVTIVGVVADARMDGALAPARALVYTNDPVDSSILSVRVAGDHIPQALDFVDRSWRRFAPNVAIQRSFLDESFQALYRDDEKQGKMFGAFVAIAITIACLGLFGLAAYTAGRRTKEIGIRKVFGARTFDLVRMLLWQFSIPVLLANVIAWPLAWYALHTWLQGFADRIVLSPLYFAAAGLAALFIACATVVTHALRVAHANPINALRNE